MLILVLLYGFMWGINTVNQNHNKMTFKTIDNTKLSTDKLKTFIDRLNKIGVEIKLSGNYPWIYIDEICGQKVKEKFEANHGFTIMFLPTRNDSPVSDFTDITEIFKLIRKYNIK